MNTVLLGNIISLAGAMIMVAIGFVKHRRDILLVQCAQFSVMAVGTLLLGGVTGAISNGVSILRNLFCLKYPLTLPFGLVFISLQFFLTLGFNNMGWRGWLPLAAASTFTLVINTKNEILLKSVIIFGQVCYVVYDLSLQNYASFAFDILTILSNIWGIISLRKRPAAESDQSVISGE